MWAYQCLFLFFFISSLGRTEPQQDDGLLVIEKFYEKRDIAATTCETCEKKLKSPLGTVFGENLLGGSMWNFTESNLSLTGVDACVKFNSLSPSVEKLTIFFDLMFESSTRSTTLTRSFLSEVHKNPRACYVFHPCHIIKHLSEFFGEELETLTKLNLSMHFRTSAMDSETKNTDLPYMFDLIMTLNGIITSADDGHYQKGSELTLKNTHGQYTIMRNGLLCGTEEECGNTLVRPTTESNIYKNQSTKLFECHKLLDQADNSFSPNVTYLAFYQDLAPLKFSPTMVTNSYAADGTENKILESSSIKTNSVGKKSSSLIAAGRLTIDNASWNLKQNPLKICVIYEKNRAGCDSVDVSISLILDVFDKDWVEIEKAAAGVKGTASEVCFSWSASEVIAKLFEKFTAADVRPWNKVKLIAEYRTGKCSHKSSFKEESYNFTMCSKVAAERQKDDGSGSLKNNPFVSASAFGMALDIFPSVDYDDPRATVVRPHFKNGFVKWQ